MPSQQAIYVNMSTHSNNESLDESYSPDSSGNDETSSEELKEYPDTCYVPYDSDVEPLAVKEQAVQPVKRINAMSQSSKEN